MKSILRDWNQFWFTQTSSTPLGVFRILFGVMVVLYTLLLFPDRDVWFSDRGILTTFASDGYDTFSTPGPRPVHLLHGHLSHGLVTLFFVVLLLAAVSFTAGFWTRTSTVLIWMGLNSLHNRDAVINNSGDTLMLVMSFLLMFAPAGAACSVDRLIRILKGREENDPPRIVPWAMRLMQIQLTIVYLCTVTSKLQGAMWLDGTAVYYATRLPEFARFPMPPIGNGQMWIINLFTYGTIAIELAMATLIWVPRFRLYVLAAGILLHCGIEYSMNIPLFSAIMISCYSLFLTNTNLKRFTERCHRSLKNARLRVVFDGECGFCRTALCIIGYCDVFRLLTFLDYHHPEELSNTPGVEFTEAENSMVAVDMEGKQFAGFYAFREIAWRLPALYLMAPFLYLPGISHLGSAAYRWIAVNRSRLPVAPRFSSANLKQSQLLKRP